MNFSDGIIDKWAEEAAQDLGEKSWRDINPNSMVLILYAIQKSRTKKILKPLWCLFGTAVIGVVGTLIALFLGKF